MNIEKKIFKLNLCYLWISPQNATKLRFGQWSKKNCAKIYCSLKLLGLVYYENND